MAAPGGLNLPVGIELSQVEKDLQKLTSSVDNVSAQLGKRLELKPTINTKAYEAAVDKMDVAFRKLQDRFSRGFDFVRKGVGENGSDIKDSFSADSLFGSIDNMKASVAQLKGMLRNPGKYELNVGDAKELVGLQELIIKNWQTSTNEIHKQDAAIKTAIANEQKLRAEQEKRIAVLREQMKAIQGDKSADLQKRLNLAQKISDEMRKWGTNSGNMRAAKNDELVRDLQRQVEQKKKAEKEDERLISLATKQEELLQKFNSANDKTLVGLQERYNISKRILDIQRQLAGTAFADQGLVNKMSGVASAADARFLRTYNQQLGLANESQAKGDLKEELKHRQRLLNTLQNREIASGASFNETQTTRERIAAIRQEIKARQDAANAQKRANQYAEKEAAILAKIKSLEDDRAKSKTLAKKIDQIHMEQRAVDNLIREYTDLFELQKKYNVDVGKTNANLVSLKKDQISLQNREVEERARIKAINQNNALLNDQEKILGKLWTTASRYLNIFMLWDFGKKIIDTTGYFQQQQVALEGILGSAAKAEQAILRIKNMALNSPKTTYELVGYTKQLAAYDVGNGDPDKLLDTVHELAELSTGLGVDMQRLILAYGQVNAASVLRGQELRQFTEAGIPLVEKLADKFSDLNGRLVTTGEVFELISKRQVSFEMVASVLSDMTKEGGEFYEMQSRITDTLYGQKQKLKDLWTINIDKLGKSSGGLLGGIVSLLQSIIRNIQPIVKGLLAIGMLKVVPKILARCVAMTDVWNAKVRSLGLQWRILTRQLSRANGLLAKFNVLQKAFSTGFGSLMFSTALIAIGALIGLIVKARQKSKEWKSTLDEINTSFAKDTVSLTSGLDKIIGKLQTLNKNSKEYKDTLETLKSNYGEYVNDGIVQSLLKEAEAAESTAVSWGKLAEAIKQAVFEKKEYERHETIKNTAIDNIIGDIEGKLENLSNVVRDKNITSYMVDDTGREFATYNEIGNELKQKNAQKALSTAAREYLTLGATEDQLPAIIDKWAKRYDFTPETAAALSGESGSVLKSIKRSSYYDEYAESESYITSALQNVINRAFQDASQRISDNYANYTGEKGKNYNPFGINAFSNEQYIEALKGLLASSYVPKDFQDKLANDKAYQDALALDNSNAGKTLAIVNALNALIGNLTDVSLKTNLAAISSEFEKIAGTNGVDASRIRTNMSNYALFGGMNLTDKEKDYIKKWEPTDKNVKSNIAEIASEYQGMYDFNKKLGDKEGTFSETYQENERLMKILDILADPEYYNQDSWLKKSGSGGSKGDFTRFFADLFGMLKSAYNDQKKLIEGPEGVTNALIESIQGLSDDNILKGFYKEGVNPFQKFLDKIEDYDINTIFSADDFKSLVNTFIKDVGVDKISVADFENMWEQLLAVVRKKAVDLRAAGKDKEASKIEAYLQTMTAERLKFFGRDEINNKIDAAIKSLTNIEEAARINSAQYQDMIAMMKTGNYKQIYGLFNPGKEYRDIDEANVAKQTLAQMLSPETKGGAGMASFIGKDMENILKSEQLGLSFIPELYAIISKIGKIGDELKDENGRVIDVKELQKVKDAFIKALKDLINGIKTETQKLSETRTKQETTTDKMYEAQQKYINKINLLNKAHEIGITEIVDGKEKTVKIDDERFVDRTTEALQEFTKNLTELLGGRYDSNIAQITGDAGSKTGSSSGGNFMQMLSSMQNGGLQSAIGTGLGQSAAGGMDMGAAAGAAGAAGGIIQMIDMIVKAIYGAIKGMVDMGKATLKVMKSYDDVKEVNIDKTGIMHVKTVYGGYDFEKAEAILDTIQQTNQHAMDGWEKLKNGDPIGATAEIYSGITDLISSIRNIEDMDEQRKIEALEDSATDLRNAATNLNASAERLVGFAKIQKELQAIGTNASLASEYKEMIRLEDSKKKSDGDKMREWQQQYEQAMNEFLNGVRKIRNEMVNSTEEWADAMGSAIRSAFQNGENAARAFRDTVKTMIGDVIEQMLQMAILEPLIESSIENWTNSSYLQKKFTKTYKDDEGIERTVFDQDNYLKELLKNIGDPNKAENFYQSMLMIGDTLIDTVNGMHPFLKDAYMHNSELGTLSGGIESVTEDTARRIEALENSQLGEVFAIRTMLQNYLEGSGFGDSMTADLQAAIASIASDTSAISRATDAILNHINELRTSPARPIHVTMS